MIVVLFFWIGVFFVVSFGALFFSCPCILSFFQRKFGFLKIKSFHTEEKIEALVGEGSVKQ